MDAREFRIGNLVQFIGGFIAEISAVKKDNTFEFEISQMDLDKQIQVYVGTGTNEDQFRDLNVSPITITKEWLLELGFKEMPYSFFVNVPYAHTKDENILVFIGKNGVEFTLGGETYLCKLKYVHQLQNLYFALTGTELKMDKYV